MRVPNKWNNYAEMYIDSCIPKELLSAYSELLEIAEKIKRLQVSLEFAIASNATLDVIDSKKHLLKLEQENYTDLHNVIVHIKKNTNLKCGWEQ